MNPRVSICIPARNAAHTLAPTLESVLAQSYGDYEVVVVDNASTDDTLDVARRHADPRLRVIRCDEPLPMGANWTRAVRQARGDLVKVVCSDDLIATDCLAVQVPMMVGGVALAASRFDLVDDDGRPIGSSLGLTGMGRRMSPADAMRTFVRRVPDELFPSAAALFRRADFARTTGFRDDFGYTLDIDLWFQLARFGEVATTAASLAVNRASTTNVSSSTSTVQKFRQILAFNRWAHRTRPEVGHRDLAAGVRRVAEVGGHRLAVRGGELIRLRGRQHPSATWSR